MSSYVLLCPPMSSYVLLCPPMSSYVLLCPPVFASLAPSQSRKSEESEGHKHCPQNGSCLKAEQRCSTRASHMHGQQVCVKPQTKNHSFTASTATQRAFQRLFCDNQVEWLMWFTVTHISCSFACASLCMFINMFYAWLCYNHKLLKYEDLYICWSADPHRRSKGRVRLTLISMVVLSHHHPQLAVHAVPRHPLCWPNPKSNMENKNSWLLYTING